MKLIFYSGPAMDSVQCPALRACPHVQKTSMDNYNKALALYPKQSKLISCGSLYQGACRLHSLYNISVAEEPVAQVCKKKQIVECQVYV